MSKQTEQIKELIAKREKARLGGGEKAIEKQHQRGKYTARERIEMLVDEGLVEEVQKLMDMGLTEDNISMKGIGYKEIIDYLNGEITLAEAVELVQKNTRHYAKRQLTWFRRYDKMYWLNISGYPSEEDAIGDMITWVRENR